MKVQDKIVVLGAGESGVGVAILAKKEGYRVIVSDGAEIDKKYRKELDRHSISYEQNGHTKKVMDFANLIVKSPGIPDTAKVIVDSKTKGVSVVSDIEFAARFTDSKLIGVTGSNGKTTTVNIIHTMLTDAGLDAGLVGNVGISFARQIANDPKDIYVIELSSFQLDYMFDLVLDVAVLLNITPDHLDRYNSSFEAYSASKFRIVQNQTASHDFVYCKDDPVINKWIKKYNGQVQLHPFSQNEKVSNGAYAVENQLVFNVNNKNQMNMETNDMSLSGKHNVYNTLASGVVGQILELKNDVIKHSMMDFKSINHRLEYVQKINDVNYINDSKATNVNATWYALESMNDSVIWIAGGVDKGNDFEMLSELVKDKVKIIICIGKDNEKIKHAFEDINIKIFETKAMEEAVKIAYEMSMPKDNVLLSPACASFDLYKNYEDRGNQFKEAIKAL